VTTTRSKKIPVKKTISLADSYPTQFNRLQTTGGCTFETSFTDLLWHQRPISSPTDRQSAEANEILWAWFPPDLESVVTATAHGTTFVGG
jgi:hypothetical protein